MDDDTITTTNLIDKSIRAIGTTTMRIAPLPKVVFHAVAAVF